VRRVLVVVAMLLVALAPPAAAADPTPAPSPGLPRACADALALIDAGRPQDAVTLVEAYRASGTTGPAVPAQALDRTCVDAHAAALAAVATAQDLALDARRLVPGGARPTTATPESWSAATSRAEQALALDVQNAEAAEVLRSAPQPAPAERVHQAWSGFVDAVGPLGAPLLALAVAVLVLAALARLVAPATLRWPAMTAPQRRFAAVLGWTAVVAGAMLLAWGPVAASSTWSGTDLRAVGTAVGALLALAAACAAGAAVLAAWYLVEDADRDARTRWWAWTTGALGVVAVALAGQGVSARGVAGTLLAGASIAALGVLLLGTVLATRLRLTIEVTSGAGERRSSGEGTGGAHLVALLGELGAEPPQGLEVPRGTDINALSGSALAELPQQAFVKAVVTVVQGLLGSVPWRVTVEEKDADHLAVIVTRNGRAAGSAVIDKADVLRFDTSDPTSAADAARVDLYRAAAAVVLMTLARHHTGFDGLCGATLWRSLALQYIAQSDLATIPARRGSLLARAVDLDPANDLAQVALAYHTARHDTDREDLDEYRDWLGGFAERTAGRSGYRSLRLRALYSRAVAAVNACFATTRDGSAATGHLDEAAVTAVRNLLDALAGERATGREDALVVSLQDAAKSMYYQAATAEPQVVAQATVAPLSEAYARAMGSPPVESWRTVPPLVATPTGEYNLACTYAILVPLLPEHVLRTTKHLRRAVVLTSLRDWLHEDPMLERYREQPDYLTEFGQDPVDLLTVAPFAPHATALRAAGLVDEDRIVQQSDPALAALLGTTPESAATVRAAAHLSTRIPPWAGRYDILDVLVAHGVDTVDVTGPGLPPDVARAVRSRVARLRLTPDDRERLEEGITSWLG
jgi:hypothetical protein